MGPPFCKEFLKRLPSVTPHLMLLPSLIARISAATFKMYIGIGVFYFK